LTIKNALRDLQSARELVAGLAGLHVGAQERARIREVERKLGGVLLSLDDIGDDIFRLQEQNQQLRKDLSDRVCPRLCGHHRGNAS
jgi:hypothetical protein